MLWNRSNNEQKECQEKSEQEEGKWMGMYIQGPGTFNENKNALFPKACEPHWKTAHKMLAW